MTKSIKNFISKSSYWIVFFILLIVFMVAFSNKYQAVELEMELIEITNDAMYFLEPLSEFEPIIYVSLKDAKSWNVRSLVVGDKVIGIFDKTGWELLDIKDSRTLSLKEKIKLRILLLKIKNKNL